MAPRVQLEKAAWRWVETVKPEEIRQEHIELAYRINLPACKRGACRRNCKGNPNCLVGIGEQAWLGEIDESAFHSIDDPNSERREKNTFVGLTNLGATCYVNTFLQVWFHNLELRRSLYQCQNSRAEEHDTESDYEPQSICEHLQYLFALLQNSNRKYIDPSGLVKALGLDTGQQQDAQEFSKLFLSLLEDTLSKQKNPNLRNVIQQQFCGQFSYVTVCNQCGRSSALPSRFYELELNIQGHKNLTECVTEFLKEEKLDGENRYFCETCQSKQNATRRIKLHSLPPTLNLQLMRFVFDRQTGHKKKLNSFISFPEQLDMGPFLEEKQDEKCVYELSAVLIHRGISAYSGHYIAHVKDARTGDWYKFNDEEIEKMEGKKLQLGIEEDIAETVKSQTKKPKCSKGYHCSRNAYMLVYKVQQEENSGPFRTNVEVPAFLQRLVDQDNHKFEEWCSEMTDMRKQSVDKGKAKHEEVKELYKLLPARDGEPYEFIPLDWLKKWLDDSTATKEIDSSRFLCSHDKLHPDKVGDTRKVSMQAAQLLYERYGGGPRLNESSLCRECVSQRCRVLRLKNQLSEDYKEISNLVKRTFSGAGFWVGKASLRSWRQLALEQLEEDEHETTHNNSQTNGQGPHTNNSKEFSSELSECTEDEMKTFNEDIVCSHGGLSILETERKLVSPEVWTKFREYFPKAPEFTKDQEPCQQCLTMEQEEKDNEAVSKMMALDQKNQLLNLFHEKNRPALTKWPQGTDVLYIVPLFFVDEWRKFIRRPTKSSPVSNVSNTLLLCPHGGFMFTYDSLINGEAQHVALLWPNEWDVISRLFIVDQPISIHCLKRTTPSGSTTQYTTQPDLCWECRESFLFQQQRDLREYTQATIYIRKVIEDKRMMKEAAPELSVSSSEAEEEKEEHPKLDGEKDPDFSQSQDGAKRLKLSDSSVSTAAAGVVTNVAKPGGIRRSTRHRKLRGEKALIVSANQTLKELKIQIMHAFSVAPFDQNLFIDGKSLTDDSATLGSLGIIPESIICLKADEPIADYAAMDDVYQVRMPEEGFKGTGLLGH
ncbi:ubiquitin carboxyl-terminal hydrolase 48 isoform X1 [Oreochromis aureus]|uniref:Ubiquitin carboxyl-terminal hydrolase 48 n=1 Tax=Oreochromis aureus TaxID=47969 RepID=A0A668S3L9_OREAU|nr:ubiquitin carboxyl-terminal hydrolase 48 isoform X1 [Oreochromis aureus]XP_039468155.1 ubiquitin carboxyl-terminal hydrolase 48 isoform X1 [Oreochromis aureus]